MRDLRFSAFILIVIATFPVETILGDKTVSQPVLITVTGTIIKAAMHLKKRQKIATHRVHQNNPILTSQESEECVLCQFLRYAKIQIVHALPPTQVTPLVLQRLFFSKDFLVVFDYTLRPIPPWAASNYLLVIAPWYVLGSQLWVRTTCWIPYVGEALCVPN